MATHKKTHRKHHIRKTYVIVGALAAICGLLGLTTLLRISALEEYLKYQTAVNSMQGANSAWQAVTVDGAQKQVYIPELNLKLSYDNQLTSQLRYLVDMPDSSVQKGEVTIGLARELNQAALNQSRYAPQSCVNPFILSVGGDSQYADPEAEISRHTLQDGRQVVIYGNTDASCRQFNDSSDRGDILTMLQKTESY